LTRSPQGPHRVGGDPGAIGRDRRSMGLLYRLRVVTARSWKCGSMDPLERNPETPPAASGQDCLSNRCSMSETLPRRTECVESRTFGSVGVGDGNVPNYPARKVGLLPSTRPWRTKSVATH
jgi:hypothetical protein